MKARFFSMSIMHIYLRWISPVTFSLRYPDSQSSTFLCNQPLILTILSNLASSAITVTPLPLFPGYFWTCWQVQTPAPAPEKLHWSPPYTTRTGCSLLTSVFCFLTEFFFFLSTILLHMPCLFKAFCKGFLKGIHIKGKRMLTKVCIFL